MIVKPFCKLTFGILMFVQFIVAQSPHINVPVISKDAVFEERNGLVAVEAEYFYAQTNSEIRAWYRTTKDSIPNIGRDVDGEHSLGACNKSYIEVLPDERVTHDDKIVHGENFTNVPGAMAIVHYKLKINTPGRYYVWARAYSTGSEDNGIHVGLNGIWPENGQRMQWCDRKNSWTWGSKQRTKEVHCGVPHQIYLDIDRPGFHDIQFSMREDGFEFDKFILTNNVNYIPIDEGPKPIIYKENSTLVSKNEFKTTLTKSYFNTIAKSNSKNRVIAAQEFFNDTTKFYKEGKRWLTINPNKNEEATANTTFNFENGKYDLVFVGVGESDGRSSFKVFINNEKILSYQPPLSINTFEEGKKFNALVKKVRLKKGDTIQVYGKIGSTDGKEHARARWAGIIFAPVGKGIQIQEAPSSYSAK